MKLKRRIATIYARTAATSLVIFAVWWFVGSIGLVNPLFLPSLPQFFAALLEVASERSLYWDMWSTSFRAFTGLFLSILIAVPLGLFFGRYSNIYEYFELPVDFFRSIPSSALFFLFVLVFGVGDASKVAVVFYGCSLIILVGTVYGARPTREKQDRIDMLLTFGASDWQIFYLSILRDALPQIAASTRVCVSLSFVLVIVTEMFLGAQDGLGHRLYNYYLSYSIAEMYSTLVVLGFLGFMANRLSIGIEKKIGFWVPRAAH